MHEHWQTWLSSLSSWFVDHGFRVLVILIVAWGVHFIAHRFIARLIRLAVVKDNQLSSEGELQRETTLVRIFNWVLRLLMLAIALMMILREVGLDIAPILAGAGIVGIAVGFGGQYLIRDFLTGFFLILENQYRIGDVVSLDQTSGKVEDISLRMTTLRDLDGTVHHVPHGDVKRVANQSKHFARINLDVAVAHQANIDQVIAVINRLGLELSEEAEWKPSIIQPPQFLRVQDINPGAMVLKVLGETVPHKQMEVAGELRKRLVRAFAEEGIPLPQSQIVLQGT